VPVYFERGRFADRANAKCQGGAAVNVEGPGGIKADGEQLPAKF
jgi:hypothetical protein